MRLWVTLFVRVWIEMIKNKGYHFAMNVTLFVRVWIEIYQSYEEAMMSVSHSLRESVD